jgi:hypothetical protein
LFAKNSRYAATPTVTATDGESRQVTAVRLRRLADTPGRPLEVAAPNQLDVIADLTYRDPTRFWHIADANTELDARNLLLPVGRTILVPEH